MAKTKLVIATGAAKAPIVKVSASCQLYKIVKLGLLKVDDLAFIRENDCSFVVQ